MPEKKTVERINKMLELLPAAPRIRLATKTAYCAKRGAFPKSAESLKAKLQQLETALL